MAPAITEEESFRSCRHSEERLLRLPCSGFSTACASAPKVPVFGTWRIALYTSPGLSAASSVQALAWVGVSATFAADDARVGGDRCGLRADTPRTLSAAEFQQEYKAPAATLGLTSDPVTVYSPQCQEHLGSRDEHADRQVADRAPGPLEGHLLRVREEPTRIEMSDSRCGSRRLRGQGEWHNVASTDARVPSRAGRATDRGGRHACESLCRCRAVRVVRRRGRRAEGVDPRGARQGDERCREGQPGDAEGPGLRRVRRRAHPDCPRSGKASSTLRTSGSSTSGTTP